MPSSSNNIFNFSWGSYLFHVLLSDDLGGVKGIPLDNRDGTDPRPAPTAP